MAENQSTSRLDTATKLVTLLSLAIALYAAYKALPLDEEIKQLQVDTSRLDLALKQAEADLKNIESSRRITLELYQEVKKVIEKRDKDSREEDAVRVLVESLAEDPFRWKLLQVLAIGAKSNDVKGIAAATSRFYEEQSVVASREVLPAAAKPSVPALSMGAYNVDFFFCERNRASSEPIARDALSLKGAGGTGRWRVRLLPESINQQPGYGVTSNQIRFTPPEERPIADAIVSALARKGVKLERFEISHPTPNYVSVFICQ